MCAAYDPVVFRNFEHQGWERAVPGLGAPLVTVMAALDNLGKGAAGQAVHNMNLMLGFEPARGLRC